CSRIRLAMWRLANPLLVKQLADECPTPVRSKAWTRQEKVQQAQGRFRELGKHGKLLACALLCISVGVLHPLATESSKTSSIMVCSFAANGVPECSAEMGSSFRRAMPFHPVTLTVPQLEQQ
ncbi:unnamed protein product, partial [Polarella glacialis]